MGFQYANVLVFAAIGAGFVLVNLLVDLLYAAIDPRVAVTSERAA